jgi:formylglycine-generating enzyme required for sulfatase activity
MKNPIVTFSLFALIACGKQEETEGTTPGDCTDGIDNDGDGDLDCDDDGCIDSSDCSGEPDTGTEDTGGETDDSSVDNDGDGISENDGDCDDSDATIYPGASDATVDGVDQDCNSFDGPDNDGDGFAPQSAGGTDCDDTDSLSTTTTSDADCDGALTVDDCDDGDPTVFPGAVDISNDGIDQDCNGVDLICGLTNCDTNLDLNGSQSIDMVLIPSGSDPQGRYDILSDFYMMTTEVTQGMFTALMSYDPTTYSTTYGVGSDYPAYYVNWHMAADFANKVTQRHNSLNETSLDECYTCTSSGSTSVDCTEAMSPYQCSGYVLPTDAEWEYAARSGTQYDFWTPDGGGDYSASTCDGTETIQDGVSNPLLADYAWYCGNNTNSMSTFGSKEVGQKLPNGFGLYDMHGNLYEWTADFWGCSYPQAGTDPYCASEFYSSFRVKRGGSWNYAPYIMGTSRRYDHRPTDRHDSIGFRLRLLQ